MIPKVLYLYWGGDPLSWLRYLTVVSFKKYNPDWTVKINSPAEPSGIVNWGTDEQRTQYKGKNYAKPQLYFDMKEVGMNNSMSEVHKSDIFRLWVLSTFGGVYCDFDVLFTKPLPKIDKRTYSYNNHYSIGFLAAEQGDEIMNQLINFAKTNTSIGKYQSYGSTLWSRALDEEPKGWNLPKNFIYSYDWTQVDSLFNKTVTLPPDAVGIHWYGGSSVASEWENKLTPTNYKQFDSTIVNIIKELA